MSKSMARKVWKLLENDLQLRKLEHCQVSKFYIMNITDLLLKKQRFVEKFRSVEPFLIASVIIIYKPFTLSP